jgi:hypothetical protein
VASTEHQQTASQLTTGEPIPKALAELKEPTMISWFGHIERISLNGQHSPHLVLSMRRLLTGRELGTAFPIRVPAAFAGALHLGDVYCGGQKVGERGSPKVVFKDLQIKGLADKSLFNEERVRPIGEPLSDQQGRQAFAFDLNDYDHPLGYTSSPVAQVPLGQSRWLLIPCWELVRFYFGASGLLLRRLLCGEPWQLKDLAARSRHDKEAEVHWLDLAPGMNRWAATTIARIAFSKVAQSCAHWITNSGMAAAAAGQRYYPKTYFPFVGATDLTVRGRWFQRSWGAVYLAERIVACTHPFPFKQLNSSVGEQVGRRLQSAGRGSSGAIQRGQSARRENWLGASPVQRGSVNTLQTGAAEDEVAFPDLTGKKLLSVQPPAWLVGPSTDESASPIGVNDGEESSRAESRRGELVGDTGEQWGPGVQSPVNILAAAIKAMNRAMPSRVVQRGVTRLRGDDGKGFDQLQHAVARASKQDHLATVVAQWPYNRELLCILPSIVPQGGEAVAMWTFLAPSGRPIDPVFVEESVARLNGPGDPAEAACSQASVAAFIRALEERLGPCAMSLS